MFNNCKQDLNLFKGSTLVPMSDRLYWVGILSRSNNSLEIKSLYKVQFNINMFDFFMENKIFAQMYGTLAIETY